jgi:hypothetical protein
VVCSFVALGNCFCDAPHYLVVFFLYHAHDGWATCYLHGVHCLGVFCSRGIVGFSWPCIGRGFWRWAVVR